MDEPNDPTEPVDTTGLRRGWRMIALVGVIPTLVAVGMGGIMGLGAFTFGYGKGFSYLKDDPAACANCHVMQDHFEAWQKSSHHKVATCNDCHLPHNFIGKWWVKSDNGFFHSLAFTTGDYHDPIQIKQRNRVVTQNACLHCHKEIVSQMLPAGDAHGPGAEMLNCVQCHNDVGHSGRRRGGTGVVVRDGPSEKIN